MPQVYICVSSFSAYDWLRASLFDYLTRRNIKAAIKLKLWNTASFMVAFIFYHQLIRALIRYTWIEREMATASAIHRLKLFIRFSLDKKPIKRCKFTSSVFHKFRFNNRVRDKNKFISGTLWETLSGANKEHMKRMSNLCSKINLPGGFKKIKTYATFGARWNLNVCGSLLKMKAARNENECHAELNKYPGSRERFTKYIMISWYTFVTLM